MKFAVTISRKAGRPGEKLPQVLFFANGPKPDEFILAIVEVDGSDTHTIYLKQSFKNAPDFTATSVNYDIQDLIAKSEILYQK
ncbi:MAG: hypothetical protein LUF78_02160 [Clostridiales bacterium]|nr:hypothetical protein [Clostridiales bacterium]